MKCIRIQGLVNPLFGAGCPGGVTGLLNSILELNPLCYWPLNELSGTAAINYGSLGVAANGLYIGPTLAQTACPGGGFAPLFDGGNDVVNIYSAALDAAFNGQLCSLLIFAKVFNVGVWTDTLNRYYFRVADDANNNINASKGSPNNYLTAAYVAGGTTETFVKSPYSNTNWFMTTITVSKDADQAKHYTDTVLTSTETGLGIFTAGAADATRNVIGAATSAALLPFYGYLAHAAIVPSVVTTTQIAAICAEAGV